MPALQTVISDIEHWSPDIVVVGGDIVNRGPSSGACLEWVLDKRARSGWHILRGNHEDFVLECDNPNQPLSGPAFEMKQFAHFALAQVNGMTEDLRSLPDAFEHQEPDREQLRVVHASMRSNRDGIYPETPDSILRKQIAPAPAVFVTGHTHRPLIRPIHDTLVVNIGSVGSSFDGDRRAGYGRFQRVNSAWQAEVVRLDYDYQQIEVDYVRSGFLERGGPMAQLMLCELRKAHGLIHRWASRYEEAVLTNRMTLEESVRWILRDEDVQPFTGPPGWSI